MIKQCKQCGSEFETSISHKKFCDKKCYKKYHYHLHKRRIASGEKELMHGPFTCKQCNTDYMAKAKDRNQFCSRECAFAFRRDVGFTHICDECGGEHNNGSGRIEGFRKLCDNCKPVYRKKVYIRRCKSCGGRFGTRTITVQFCSGKCASLNYAKLKHIRTARSCQCKQCGALFSRLYGNKMRAFCSVECRAAYSTGTNKFNIRAQRKIIEFYGKFAWRSHYMRLNRLSILKRDKWTCYICQRELNKEYVKPYHEANATVDHVVPLAFGGEHLMNNVKACCAECNARKSDSISGAVQLPLIGSSTMVGA